MTDYGFTLEEVEELLPEVSVLLEEAVAVNKEIKQTYKISLKLKAKSKKDQKKETQKKIKLLNQELDEITEELEELGINVRDVESGIVDFPGQFQGKDIYFCWHLGEKKVEFWHYADSSFSNRNKILKLGE